MKRAISKIGVGSIMIMIAIIIAVLIACGILTPEKQSGFWGQLGITRESIKEVQHSQSQCGGGEGTRF